MNIQIYGKTKCFDTKKAERYFKERGVRFQSVDILKKGLSAGELRSVMQAVGGLDALIDTESAAYQSSFIAHLASKEAKEEKLMDVPALYRTPIVRNGRQATVGYAPETWVKWE